MCYLSELIYRSRLSVEQHGDAVHLLSDSDRRNQCVFLRGYRICDRKTAFRRIFRRKRFDGFKYFLRKNNDDDDNGSDPGPSGSRNPPSGGVGGNGNQDHSNDGSPGSDSSGGDHSWLSNSGLTTRSTGDQDGWEQILESKDLSAYDADLLSEKMVIILPMYRDGMLRVYNNRNFPLGTYYSSTS